MLKHKSNGDEVFRYPTVKQVVDELLKLPQDASFLVNDNGEFCRGPGDLFITKTGEVVMTLDAGRLWFGPPFRTNMGAVFDHEGNLVEGYPDIGPAPQHVRDKWEAQIKEEEANNKKAVQSTQCRFCNAAPGVQCTDPKCGCVLSGAHYERLHDAGVAPNPE